MPKIFNIDTMRNIFAAINCNNLSDTSEETTIQVNQSNEKSNVKTESIENDELILMKWVNDHFCGKNIPSDTNKIMQLTNKMKKYGFHTSHCIQALVHVNNNYQQALELLFCKYHEVENIKNCVHMNCETTIEYDRLAEIKQLKLKYGNMFSEKIRNCLWSVQLEIDYLKNNMRSIQNSLKTDIHNECNFLQEEHTPNLFYTLEIRFPKDCKYPYEPPYFYFYKNDESLSDIIYLKIAKKLYNEALSFNGKKLSMLHIISLLNNSKMITNYLAENTEKFLDETASLFQENQKSLNVDKNLKIFDMNVANYNVHRFVRNKINLKKQIKENDLIKKHFIEKQTNSLYREKLKTRMNLPAWSCLDIILKAIQKNQVIIISGETGCGKSTQVPQFILDDWLNNRSSELMKSNVNIVCTQPRRISAIGVAQRVATERNECIGDTVGYHIRLEKRVSFKTRITFCTLGILLQKLKADPKLSGVTHIIIDEVHERSADSDFLLMFLKDLICTNSILKVILMSATIKADIFSSYFGNAPIIYIPGRIFAVEQIFLEDLFEKTKFIFTKDSKYMIRSRYNEVDKELIKVLSEEKIEEYKSETTEHPAELPHDIEYENALDNTLTLERLIRRYPNYNRLTYKNLYITNYKNINFDLIEKTLEWIIFGTHNYIKWGSILVFLPGINEISVMMSILQKNKFFCDTTKFFIVPLHSSLSNEEQNRVFMKTESHICKIVLSTNLAETSITIQDCVYVIDTGMMKQIEFNPIKDMESLETCWISRANVLQRKGRAGRVLPGVCIHLYTSHRFKYGFDEELTPEIKRISLEQLVLRIYIMYKKSRMNVHEIFDKMIDPPTDLDITSAMERLQNTGAFDSTYELTPLGHHLAKLPMNVRIGKLILYGTIFCCLDSALTIAACLSYNTPFKVPFEKRDKIQNPKLKFFIGYSDHLTVLQAYNMWLERTPSPHFAAAFAAENFLCVSTLRNLADLKYEFLELLVSIGFIDINLPPRQPGVDRILNITGPEINVNIRNYKLLQCLLCAALYPNIAIINEKNRELNEYNHDFLHYQRTNNRTFVTKQNEIVHIHPSSVNHIINDFRSPYVVYHEKIKTSKVFISEVTMISTLSLILFSGYKLDMTYNGRYYILSLDSGWIQFSIESHMLGLHLQLLRKELTKLLEEKMQNPMLNVLNYQEGKRIIDIITAIITKE